MPPPPPQHLRIDLLELKSQITGKLGPEKSRHYFSCLSRLLGQKLTKSQFDKLCFAAVGRENIPLHNQFIRAILRNAAQAKVPPAVVHNKDALKLSRVVGKKPSSVDAGLRQTSAVVPPWSNGKSRSTNCRIKDQLSPLGPNGQSNAVAHQLQVPSEVAVVRENGDLFTCDLKRPLQHQQGWSAEVCTKKQRAEKSLLLDRITLHGSDPLEVVAVEDGKVEETEGAQSIEGPLRAPLGIPYCSASIGGARRAAPLPTCSSSSSSSSHGFPSSYYGGELYHTEDLRKRMQQIAEVQGLGGVTMECANLLNNGLDAYLKRLIRSCVDLEGARFRSEPIRHSVFKRQAQGKIINGMLPSNHMHIQSSAGSLEGTQEKKNYCRLSVLDFRVAMELNPQQLGDDWPLLLEKVCLHSFEE